MDLDAAALTRVVALLAAAEPAEPAEPVPGPAR